MGISVPEPRADNLICWRDLPTRRIRDDGEWYGNNRQGITLSPGERTEFAELFEVDSDKPYYVDVVVGAEFARPWLLEWLPGTDVPQQWRARAVSTPIRPRGKTTATAPGATASSS